MRALKRWAHVLMPGHGYLMFYSGWEKHRGWFSDGIGKVYGCRCGKRWYE